MELPKTSCIHRSSLGCGETSSAVSSNRKSWAVTADAEHESVLSQRHGLPILIFGAMPHA